MVLLCYFSKFIFAAPQHLAQVLDDITDHTESCNEGHRCVACSLRLVYGKHIDDDVHIISYMSQMKTVISFCVPYTLTGHLKVLLFILSDVNQYYDLMPLTTEIFHLVLDHVCK